MKVLEMEWLLSLLREEYDLQVDADILLQDEDGCLQEFKVEYVEESFDGFTTAYPAGLKIVKVKENQQ